MTEKATHKTMEVYMERVNARAHCMRPILAAGFALAMALTFTACSGGGKDGELGEPACGEWEATAPATCKAAGAEARDCSDGTSETRPVAKLDWQTTAIPATCEEEGEKTKTCPDGSTETEAIAMLEWGEWETTTPATCAAAGAKTKTCPDGTEETEQIARLSCGGGYTPPPPPVTPSSSSITPSSSSITPSSSSAGGYAGEYGSLTDIRDGQIYKTVVIGAQTWMAENLRYNVTGSRCFSEINSSFNYECDGIHGRLYGWAMAMDFDDDGCYSNLVSSLDCDKTIETPHRGICPEGWHIPTKEEWSALSSYVEINSSCGSNCAGKHLKATSRWGSNNGLDTYGFAAVPVGISSVLYESIGNMSDADWWSSSERNATQAYDLDLNAGSDRAILSYKGKTTACSVRCLHD